LTHAGEVVFIEQKRLINQSGADYNTALIVIDNLLRLGLIERDIPVFKEKSPNVMDISFRMSSDYNEKSKIEVSNSFGLTKFGEAFIRKVYY
jgi:predicted transcriptional regulator